MKDLVVGMLGCLLPLAFFLLGVFAGRLSRESSVGKWLDEHGCYLCREKHRYGETDAGEDEDDS